MTLAQFFSLCMMLVQQGPPPPVVPTTMDTTPPGGVVPLDTNIWILLIIAVALIVCATLPRLKKEI
jgi:hypothetical protein